MGPPAKIAIIDGEKDFLTLFRMLLSPKEELDQIIDKEFGGR